MKAITLYVSEPVYREFQTLARQKDKPAAELIRESMNLYLKSLHAPERRSLAELEPVSLGRLKRPLKKRSDYSGDLLDAVRA